MTIWGVAIWTQPGSPEGFSQRRLEGVLQATASFESVWSRRASIGMHWASESPLRISSQRWLQHCSPVSLSSLVIIESPSLTACTRLAAQDWQHKTESTRLDALRDWHCASRADIWRPFLPAFKGLSTRPRTALLFVDREKSFRGCYPHDAKCAALPSLNLGRLAFIFVYEAPPQIPCALVHVAPRILPFFGRVLPV